METVLIAVATSGWLGQCRIFQQREFGFDFNTLLSVISMIKKANKYLFFVVSNIASLYVFLNHVVCFIMSESNLLAVNFAQIHNLKITLN